MTHRYSIQVPIMCDVVVEANSSRDALQQVALMKIEGLNPDDVVKRGVISEVDPIYHSRTGHQFVNIVSATPVRCTCSYYGWGKDIDPIDIFTCKLCGLRYRWDNDPHDFGWKQIAPKELHQ